MGGEQTIRVLVVEDNAGDFRLLADALRDNPLGPLGLVHADRLSTALERLGRESFDALLLDLSLPDSAGLGTFARIRERAPHLPVVVMTGLDDDNAALQVVRAGAQDYLVKGQSPGATIVRSIRFAVERNRWLAVLHDLAYLDELTGLYNRRGFQAAADQQLRLSARRGSGFWLLFADLDGLKAINDRAGHEVGDAALIETSEVLKKTFRASDVLARLGGDEFVVLAIDAARDSNAVLRKRFATHLAERNAAPGRSYQLSISFGMVRFDPAQPVDLPGLLAEADRSLYEDKHRPRS